ncbi:MAG: energy transducer TonB [Acidobacteria bacterium]|nr:energy transducer TonB [Acidobacteriota bacterium]
MKFNAPLLVSLLVCLAAPVLAQERMSDPLEAARLRYAAADYDGTIAALPSTDASGVEANRLRALSLLALGRVAEAEVAIERLVLAAPGWVPGDDLSPRVRVVVRGVRDRVLPDTARQAYDEGRRAYERHAYAGAIAHLERAITIAEALALEGQPGMEDLRILADGFLTLSRSLLPPPVVTPPVLASSSSPIVVPLAALVNAPAEAAESEVTAAVVSAADASPTFEARVIRQDLPPWRLGLGGPGAVFRGVIDVQIDAEGRVVASEMVVPVHPGYDPELMRAARDWRYEPARREGVPVPTRRRVEVALRSR